MRILITTLAACLLGACAAPRPLPRAALVPLYDLPVVPVLVPNRSDPPTAVQPAGRPQQPSVVDSVRGQEPSAPIYRTVIEIVEVPVEGRVEMPQVYEPEPRRDYRQYDDYLRYRSSYRHRSYRRSRFPVNTVVGAGIGAIIGHQRGRRDRGALIGGGVGLLFDLNRW